MCWMGAIPVYRSTIRATTAVWWVFICERHSKTLQITNFGDTILLGDLNVEIEFALFWDFEIVQDVKRKAKIWMNDGYEFNCQL